MTQSLETTALQKLSSVEWEIDGSNIFNRSFTQQGARQLRADLGEYAVVALGLVLCEGDRKVMMKRVQAESLMALEGFPLNVRKPGIAM
jgi:hypothetical protein